MHNGDGSRPRIRPAVSNRFDNSSYYEYIERQTAHSDPQAQPAQHTQVRQQSQNSQQQPPRKSASMMWLTGIAVFAIVALAVTVGFVLLGPNTGVEPTAPRPASTTEQTDTTGSGKENESPNEQAKNELESAVADSESELSKLEEKWVVQLSAKRPGEDSGDGEWDYAKILQEYRDNEKKYGKVAMLKSEKWSSFRVKDFWVTVIPTGYDSPEPALKKCEEFKLDRDHCFAKRLSHTMGPDGSTKLRD